MVKLYNNKTDAFLGEISEDELQFLIDQLEEEWDEDRDYYINWPTLDMFEARGVPAYLLEMLRNAMVGQEDIEVRWSRR